MGAAPPNPRSGLLFAGVALLAAACSGGGDAGTGAGTGTGAGSGSGSGGSPVTTTLHPSAPPLPGEAACKVVEVTGIPEPDFNHIQPCTPLTYATNPPSGGDHWPIWAAFKIYTTPVPREMYVHDLEHGAIVLAYKCTGACPDVVAALTSVLDAMSDPECLSLGGPAGAHGPHARPGPADPHRRRRVGRDLHRHLHRRALPPRVREGALRPGAGGLLHRRAGRPVDPALPRRRLRRQAPAPGTPKALRDGGSRARVLEGDPRLTRFRSPRPHRTVAATHTLHGLCPEGASGSTAATRKDTLEPDGEAPASVYLVLVHAMGAEYVVASAALVAC